MKSISYAIYDSEIQSGGVYNVLASFERGLFKGMQEAGLKVCNYNDCKNIPDVVIGFNLIGENNFEEVLNSHKIINIMWSVDSVFSNNYTLVKHVSDCKNYVQFSVTSADSDAVKQFMPQLNYFYMPHATDLDLWKNEHKKDKENDIVLFSSVRDYEQDLDFFKNICTNAKIYKLVTEIIDILLKRPNDTFLQVYNFLKNLYNIQFTADVYSFIYNFTTTYVEQVQKVRMIQALSNSNVKVYGNDIWAKYVKGKVEYKGSANIYESIKIMNNSKISLHCHPVKLNGGLHERFLNAGAVGAFNLVSDSPDIRDIFGDTFDYFNHTNFEDIEEKANYYLQNEDERIAKTEKTFEMIRNNHTWKHRAIEINKLFEKNL